MRESRYRVEWGSDGDALVAFEPSAADVRAAAGELAAGYNEPHNRMMIANEHDYTAEDVAVHFATMAAEGARTFLLYRGAELVGDADFRHIAQGRAEFAILVAARTLQGRGLGTRFARMLHVLAFRAFGLERCYVTILPANAASCRLFEKLGYQPDASDEARAYADDETDLSFSLAREEFERREGEALGEVRLVAQRAP